MERDHVIESLAFTMRDGNHGLQHFPQLLKRVIREECWRHRIIDRDRVSGKDVRFAAFSEFISALPVEGLGATEQVVRDLCRHDKEAMAMLDVVLKRGDGNPTGANQYTREANGTVDIVNSSSESLSRPTGNSAAAARRRLAKDRPDLLQKVVAGELSPHAAMVEAGFRKNPSALDLLRRAWGIASEEDRSMFLDEIGNSILKGSPR